MRIPDSSALRWAQFRRLPRGTRSALNRPADHPANVVFLQQNVEGQRNDQDQNGTRRQETPVSELLACRELRHEERGGQLVRPVDQDEGKEKVVPDPPELKNPGGGKRGD